MTILKNQGFSGRAEMIAAIRAMQIELGQPVCSSIDDQAIGQQIVKLQKYLSTVPDTGYPSGFIYNPALVESNIADTSLQQQIIALQAAYLGRANLVLSPIANRNQIAGIASGAVTSYSSVAAKWNGNAPVTGVVLRFPWYFKSSVGVETLIGNGCTATASIEYPSGTRTQCFARVGGSASMAIVDGTYPDMVCAVNIPAFAKFWVHFHADMGGSGKFPLNIINSSTTGDRNENNSTDKTMVGTVAANVTPAPGGANAFSPCVAGYIPPTCYGDIAVGDSILASIMEITGANYVASVDAFGNVGWFEKVWHGLNGAGVWNLARASSAAFQWAGAGAMARTLGMMAEMTNARVYNALGHNDMGNTPAATATAQGTINTQMTPLVKKVVGVKLTPYTNSSNSFIDAAGQTQFSGNNAAYNALVAAGSIAGQTGFIDLMAAFKDQVTQTEIWPYDGATTFKFTPEGVHPNPPAVTQAVSLLPFPA